MIQKYYRGIVEQVYKKIGSDEQNIAIAKYSNDFSLTELSLPKHITTSREVYFASLEFEKGEMSEAYEPFLGVIRDTFQCYWKDSFEAFMDECHIYALHRPIICSYMKNGCCERVEQLLYNETRYEQEKMTEEIAQMLITLSGKCPMMILINRLQHAARSTILMLLKLMESEDTKNIGIVLGINELQRVPEYINPVWEELLELLEDNSAVFRIGNAERIERADEKHGNTKSEFEEELRILRNLVCMLDFEQALFYFEKINRRIKFDNYLMSDAEKFEIWYQYAYVSIYTRDLSKALEISEDIRQLSNKETGKENAYYAYCIMAMAYVYQGKLQEAIEKARKAQEIARKKDIKRKLFEAELLEVQAEMSGWNNIFFCAQDVAVSDEMIDKLIQYHYRNHLAHIYVYAYDNKPSVVAEAYHSEEKLVYFSKGVKLAKEIGNEQLIYDAYQKNIMLASTNGMNEIAVLYSVRTFESMSNKKTIEGGRICSGIGYNLSALGQNEMAIPYFLKSIQIFYELNLPEDIAEVYYNMALNAIGMKQYEEAKNYLMFSLKAVERLRLNSLRVCNLSKLYGLLALCSQKSGDRFNCEQYLNCCKQFLNYIIERDKDIGTNDVSTVESIHDYAKYDDDMFLYCFTQALLYTEERDEISAFSEFTTAETHLLRAEGNQFFCYKMFRKERIRFFRRTQRLDLLEREKVLLEQYAKEKRSIDIKQVLKILEPVEQYMKEEPIREISEHELTVQLKQESINRSYKQEKRQMDFISTWQKLIDVSNVQPEEMLENAMHTFLYHFNVDNALYVQYRGGKTQILYNDTETELTEEMTAYWKEIFAKSGKGFAVSKISSNYAEHLDVIEMFGEERVCSMVAIPFFDNQQVTSIMITYVLMKDNWHSSVNRYMLDESDLRIYELLFREVQYSLNRLYAYEKIFEMNTELYRTAVTDQLTGILNRKGFYQNISGIVDGIKAGEVKPSFGIMFIDLDNFKGYNDTFGHNIGDLLLRSMAKIFEEVCGENGFVTRYGGDEFIIFQYTDEKAILEKMAKQIYKEIKKQDGFKSAIEAELGEAVLLDEKKKLSCSIGIISSHEATQEADINEMIKQADDLLYEVKATSKGTYKFL